MDAEPLTRQNQPGRTVSVVIRSNTREEALLRLIELLSMQTRLPDEIVVIDSGSADGIVARLRELHASGVRAESGRTIPLRLIEIPQSSYQSARTLNQAIRISSGELIAIISQDAMPANSGYLLHLTSGFVDPRIAGAYGRQIADIGDHPLGEKDHLKAYPPHSRIQYAPDCWFVNACSMVRRDIWEQHPFDEGAIISEDHEWAKWVQEQGFAIRYEADALVTHYHHFDTLRELWARHYAEGQGLFYVHGQTMGLLRTMARCLREIMSDGLWLMARGRSWLWAGSFVRRPVKYAALYQGHRKGAVRLNELGGGAAYRRTHEVMLKLEHVWRLYRLWRRRPTTLKEAFVHFFHRDRTAYEDFWALKGVSLTVRRGEVLGICGSNGSGKSTLLKVIARILPATHGCITVRGRVATLLELSTGFHPELSGRENIYLNAALLGLAPSETASKMDAIVDFADLGEFIDCPVKTYSAGMCMRLGFSVISQLESDILLIDEVLAVGDSEFQKKCAGWIERLKSGNTTVVVVSHDLQTLEQMCDRVVWLHQGRVVAEGEPLRVLQQYCPTFVPSRKEERVNSLEPVNENAG